MVKLLLVTGIVGTYQVKYVAVLLVEIAEDDGTLISSAR